MLGPFLPNKALQAVQTAWAMGSDFVDKGSSEEDGNAMMPPKSQGKPVYRIDVGRGWKKAIVYLNDLERDPEYSQWPRSLQQMFMSMQFGMAPSIRRNLFTFFGILDPVSPSPPKLLILLSHHFLTNIYSLTCFRTDCASFYQDGTES